METQRISDDEIVRYAVSLGLTPSAVFPRSTVQQIECARCRARPGLPCHNRNGVPRTANHLERCFDRIRDHLENKPAHAWAADKAV